MQASGRTVGSTWGCSGRGGPSCSTRGDPAGYDKRVTTTWALAFAALGGEGPAAGLLRLVACCAAEDIPLDVLLRPGLAAEDFDAVVGPVLVPLLDDELARDEAVAGLRRFSLISAPRGGLISVHRLVQAITLDQLPEEEAEAWRRAAAAVIGAALPGDPEDPGCWPVFAVLLPHAQAALDPASDGMDQVARYLGASGSYAAALAVQQQVLHAREEIRGAEHPDTLTACADLARWTGRAGDPAGARDQFAALVPVIERVLGAGYSGTFSARSNLAYWTGRAGDPAGARDQFAALVPVIERVLGAEHPGTLTARSNLARWTGAAGDAAGARDQSPRCCRSASGSPAPSTPRHSPTDPTWPITPGRRGIRPGPGTSSPRWCRSSSGSWAPGTPRHSPPAPTWPAGPGRRGMRPGPGTSSPRWCRSASGSPAPSTPPRSPSAPTWPTGPGRRGMRPGPGTSSPRCCRSASGSSAPSTPTRSPTAPTWPAGPGEAGDAAGARDQFAALVPVRERVSGAEHPATLTTRASLAHWTRLAQNPE